MPSSRLSASIVERKLWPWQRKSPKNSARDFAGITPETSLVAVALSFGGFCLEKLFAHPASVPCTELHAPFRRAKDCKHPPFTLLISLYANAEGGILYQGSLGTQTEGSKSCSKR